MYVLYIDMNTACVLGKVPKVLQPYTIHRRRVHKAIMVYIDICIGGHRYAYMYIMYVDTYLYVCINLHIFKSIYLYRYKYIYIRRRGQGAKSAAAARNA